MQRQLAYGLAVLLVACASRTDVAMTNPLLSVHAACRGNPQCSFTGEDIPLDVTITNDDVAAIGFPLAYRRKTGPVIRLVDRRTKAETYLKTNLADFDLRDELTSIRPGESVAISWVITADELRQFGGTVVDVTAEIVLAARVQVGDEFVDFRGADTLQIVSNDKP